MSHEDKYTCNLRVILWNAGQLPSLLRFITEWGTHCSTAEVLWGDLESRGFFFLLGTQIGLTKYFKQYVLEIHLVTDFWILWTAAAGKACFLSQDTRRGREDVDVKALHRVGFPVATEQSGVEPGKFVHRSRLKPRHCEFMLWRGNTVKHDCLEHLRRELTHYLFSQCDIQIKLQMCVAT